MRGGTGIARNGCSVIKILFHPATAPDQYSGVFFSITRIHERIAAGKGLSFVVSGYKQKETEERL
jgi:hypothetical protein